MTHWYWARDAVASTLPIIGARAQDDAPNMPMADVKPPEFKIEKSASLKVLRPARFIATGSTTPEVAAKQAAHQAKRYYKS